MANVSETAHASHGEHGDHGDRPAFLQHHFDTPAQQFDASKLGMWVFIATEILMFGGLFCAYAIWRAMEPQIFMGSCSDFSSSPLMKGMRLSTISGQLSKVFPAPEIA